MKGKIRKGKFKLFIKQYDIMTNDYKIREEVIETLDLYHEIGWIYCNTLEDIKRIDYVEIEENKK